MDNLPSALLSGGGALGILLLRRLIEKHPMWEQLASVACVCMIVAGGLILEPVKALLLNPNKPILSTVILAVAVAIVAGAAWRLLVIPRLEKPKTETPANEGTKKEAPVFLAETESPLKLRIFQMKFSNIAGPGEPNGVLPLVVVSAEVRNTGPDPLDCVNWMFEARPADKPTGPKAQPHTVDEVALPTGEGQFVRMAGSEQLHRKTYGKAISKNERVAGFIQFRFPGRTISEISGGGNGGGRGAPNTFFLSCVDSSGRTASISRGYLEIDGVAPQLWPGIEYLPGSDGSKQEFTPD